MKHLKSDTDNTTYSAIAKHARRRAEPMAASNLYQCYKCRYKEQVFVIIQNFIAIKNRILKAKEGDVTGDGRMALNSGVDEARSDRVLQNSEG